MKNDSRKELARQYKERKIVGGVYVIKNTRNDKWLLEATVDLPGGKNRFAFAQKTNSCTDLKLQQDWQSQNGEGFVFEVLEELEQGKEQTPAEFKEDVRLLKEIWLEKLAGRILY